MPRPPRIFVPDLPLHVVHRGNNRQRIFAGPDDLNFYRGCLIRASRKYAVAMHAYVLMSNHVHLLATAPLRGQSASNDAVRRLHVRQILQHRERSQRNAVGGAVPCGDHQGRSLSPDLHAVHRAQSGAQDWLPIPRRIRGRVFARMHLANRTCLSQHMRCITDLAAARRLDATCIGLCLTNRSRRRNWSSSAMRPSDHR